MRQLDGHVLIKKINFMMFREMLWLSSTINVDWWSRKVMWRTDDMYLVFMISWEIGWLHDIQEGWISHMIWWCDGRNPCCHYYDLCEKISSRWWTCIPSWEGAWIYSLCMRGNEDLLFGWEGVMTSCVMH